jgi:hypothetical protein
VDVLHGIAHRALLRLAGRLDRRSSWAPLAAAATVTGSGARISMPIGRTASRMISSASSSLPLRPSRSFEDFCARMQAGSALRTAGM